MATPYQTKTSPLALIALAGAILLASLGISITSIALPTLSAVFSAPVAAIQWVVLIYLISVTVTIVLAGRCGDLFGHRFMLITGLIIFAIASMLCAIAPTLGTLIAARAVQGIGGAILMALPMSIIRSIVAKERTGAAMGLLGTMSSIGTALGPSLGGVMIAHFGWRSTFILLAVTSVLVIGFTLRGIPAVHQNSSKKGVLDLSGAALLAVALIFYALATTGSKGGVNLSLAIILPAALTALTLFIIVQTRSKSPLVPVAVLRNPLLGTSLITNMLVTTVMMATLIVGPFFLTFGLHLNATVTGLTMAVGPVAAALSGIPAGRMTDRFGALHIMQGSLISITVALICLAYLPVSFGVAGYIFALILLTPGFQLFLTANNTTIMLTAPEDQRGMLSGLLGLSRNLGFMTGASVMATVFATAIGPQEITQTSALVIGRAFTITFLVAAGLTLLALCITLMVKRK